MSVAKRNNVSVSGEGPATMFFAHGFGCDQNMWRLLAPVYANRCRIVRFDLVGSGQSDPSAYDPVKYGFIVCEIAKAHRGRCYVRSTEDEGTTFGVVLPRLPEATVS